MPRVDTSQKIQISKIEAAKRQLDCAIELWFLDKDEVSIHTLIGAAYRIIHDINKHRKTNYESAFAPDFIKDEYRKEWARMVKEPSNFFKHADEDPEGTISFAPFSSLMFMLYATKGLGVLDQHSSNNERIFTLWLFVHEQRFLSPAGVEFLKKGIPVEHVEQMRPLSKKEFFEAMSKVAADYDARRRS